MTSKFKLAKRIVWILWLLTNLVYGLSTGEKNHKEITVQVMVA